MKIALISAAFLPAVDGVTVSLYRRVQVLSRLGHEVLVLCSDYRSVASRCPDWRDYVGEILPGVRVVGLPSEPFMGVEVERNLSRPANPILQQQLNAFQPDVIHVDEPDRLFLGVLNAPGVAYAKAKGVPCVGFYHTNYVDYIEDYAPLPRPLVALLEWVSTQIIHRVFNAYDATLTASPITERRMRQMGIRNTVCDRFLGVDVQRFQSQSPDPQYFQTRYGIVGLADKIKLVFLGRLTADKGWRFTLQAFADWVNQSDSNSWVDRTAIIIAGEGELRDEILAGLQSLGLTVRLIGQIAPDEIPQLLINSDIHITASEKETLGLTILEAFAAGIPVIAPRAGGVATLIRDGENGLLFAPRDGESFRRSLLSLMSDADLRRKLGRQGQEDVASYDWDAAVMTLLNAWETQISRRQPQ